MSLRQTAKSCFQFTTATASNQRSKVTIISWTTLKCWKKAKTIIPTQQPKNMSWFKHSSA